MWIVTPHLFVSIVQKPKDGPSRVTVRARRRADLERFRGLVQFPLEVGPIQAGGGTDYPFRFRMTRAAFAQVLAALAVDVTYPNMKAAVPADQARRHRAYTRAWSAFLGLEEGPFQGLLGLAPAQEPRPKASGKGATRGQPLRATRRQRVRRRTGG